MQEFLRDIEEDPELRQSISLYKDQEVIDALEAQMASMSIEKQKDQPSPVGEALEAGKAKVSG
jgi:hypothetical protein